MIKILHAIRDDVRNRKNLDVYIAILVNLVLSVLSLLDVLPQNILGASILASLSWLTLNILIERRDSEERITNLMDQIRLIQPVKHAGDFFTQNYVHNSEEFQKAFQSAHEVYIVGLGQHRMVVAYGAQIQRVLAEGGKLSIILCDPDGDGTAMAAKRGSMGHDTGINRDRQMHWAAVERLRSLNGLPENKSLLELKFIDILFPYTLYGFDWHDAKKAKIFVWFTPLLEPSERRPGFVISLSEDMYWFEFFKRQFELLWKWEAAHSYDIGKNGYPRT